jgi:hypothetical protein
LGLRYIAIVCSGDFHGSDGDFNNGNGNDNGNGNGNDGESGGC